MLNKSFAAINPRDQINAECDTALLDYGANTTTPPTVGAVADAVWDEEINDHIAVGTFGQAVRQIKSIANAILGLIS